MILALDLGNTQIKAAVFEHNTLIEKYWIAYENANAALESILTNYPQIDTLCHSAVVHNDKFNFSTFKDRFTIYQISRESRFPFINAYTTPETLGIDRMVLAAGAVLHYPNRNRLVIDAGTCITYDFISNDDVYLGGAISPGLQMRYQALHHFTDQLPELHPQSISEIIGNSTSTAIHSGVIHGVLFELEGCIERYSEKKDNIIIILTGGDANFLAGHLKNTIFANPNFLLESSIRLYEFQNND
jgi:type III pantothenate kinase